MVNVVLAMRDAVPAHEMVSWAFKSAAIVGRAVDIPFWSMKDIKDGMASIHKTGMSFRRGSRSAWSWRAVSANLSSVILYENPRTTTRSKLRSVKKLKI